MPPRRAVLCVRLFELLCFGALKIIIVIITDPTVTGGKLPCQQISKMSTNAYLFYHLAWRRDLSDSPRLASQHAKKRHVSLSTASLIRLSRLGGEWSLTLQLSHVDRAWERYKNIYRYIKKNLPDTWAQHLRHWEKHSLSWRRVD